MVQFVVNLSRGLNLFCISFCRQSDVAAVEGAKALIRYTSPFGGVLSNSEYINRGIIGLCKYGEKLRKISTSILIHLFLQTDTKVIQGTKASPADKNGSRSCVSTRRTGLSRNEKRRIKLPAEIPANRIIIVSLQGL